MQNSGYPFNQTQHVFDFKVKVNFENGNVSLTAPQIVTPPAYFGNQPTYHPNHHVYTSSSLYTNSYNNNSTIQRNPITSNFPPQQVSSPPPLPTYHPPTSPPITHPSIPFPPHHYPIPQPLSNPKNPHQPIQLVNSSYTSMLNQSDYFQMINNSMQVIECVLCQKSFNITQFDQHLELHRNKNNRTQVSSQKNNVSNYAMTQNSFNANNDSMAEGDRHQPSYHNGSFSSSSTSKQQQSIHNDSEFVPNFVTVNGSSMNQHNNLTNNNRSNNNNPLNTNYHPQQSLNQSSQLLGRIDNPILAINAQNQANLSLSSSSHHQSLSYSNSQNQSLQRLNNPTQTYSLQQSPNFNQVNNSNGSSFGHQGGNNLIGPSFYHNSSQESGGNVKNGPFVKGINRLASYEQNNNNNISMGSHYSSNGEMIINPNTIVPNVFLPNNQSYHSHHCSHQQHPSYGSNGLNGSIHSYHSNHSNHSQQQQYLNSQMMNNSHQHYQPHNHSNNLRNSQNSSLHQPSYHSNHSLQNNFFPQPSHNDPSPSQPLLNNFQTIQSRYLNQAPTNSRQLYASQQQLIKNSRNASRQYQQQQLFNENDISSISRSSRRDMSEYSDWSDFNSRKQEEEKMHGYNSADNSIIKHMQSKKQEQQSQNQKNVYLDRSQSKQKGDGFMKKKKDHLIASTASYYQRKFKDQDYSSSDDQQFVNKTGRLSYAQRLKQKKVTDNSRPLELSSNTKSGRASRNLKQSTKSINSEDSSLSKTKLPVNYLAREQFISTSSTSKSTHKTNLPN